jgi:hypothetical protein
MILRAIVLDSPGSLTPSLTSPLSSDPLQVAAAIPSPVLFLDGVSASGAPLET